MCVGIGLSDNSTISSSAIKELCGMRLDLDGPLAVIKAAVGLGISVFSVIIWVRHTVPVFCSNAVCTAVSFALLILVLLSSGAALSAVAVVSVVVPTFSCPDARDFFSGFELGNGRCDAKQIQYIIPGSGGPGKSPSVGQLKCSTSCFAIPPVEAYLLSVTFLVSASYQLYLLFEYRRSLPVPEEQYLRSYNTAGLHERIVRASQAPQPGSPQQHQQQQQQQQPSDALSLFAQSQGGSSRVNEELTFEARGATDLFIRACQALEAERDARKLAVAKAVQDWTAFAKFFITFTSVMLFLVLGSLSQTIYYCDPVPIASAAAPPSMRLLASSNPSATPLPTPSATPMPLNVSKVVTSPMIIGACNPRNVELGLSAFFGMASSGAVCVGLFAVCILIEKNSALPEFTRLVSVTLLTALTASFGTVIAYFARVYASPLEFMAAGTVTFPGGLTSPLPGLQSIQTRSFWPNKTVVAADVSLPIGTPDIDCQAQCRTHFPPSLAFMFANLVASFVFVVFVVIRYGWGAKWRL